MKQSTKLLLAAAVLYLATHQATAEFFSLDGDNPQSRQPGIIGYDGEIPETPLLPSASLTNETTDVGHRALEGDDPPPYVTKCKENCRDHPSKEICEKLCTLCYLTCAIDEPMQVMACFEERCSVKSASSLANTGHDSNSKRRRMMECRDCAAYQNDPEKMKKCRDHCLGKPMNSDDGSTTKTIAEPYLRGV